MKTTTWIALAASFTVVGVFALQRARATDERSAAVAATQVDATTQGGAAQRVGGVLGLEYALPFTLEANAVHAWRSDAPEYDAGWLLVLSVDPSFVEPRQIAEPVLYAGDQTVERVNHGHRSGRVIAIVPAARNADGTLDLDLAATPFWFGAAELPERIDAAAIVRERADAERRDVRAFTAAEIAAARAAAGEAVALRSREDLLDVAAQLVLQESPEDEDLGRALLAPRLRKP